MDMMDEYASPEDIISDILTEMCHAVTRTIELIRRAACAYAIQEIVDSVEQTIVSEPTTVPH